KKGLKAVPLSGWQIPLETDNSYGKARILEIGTKKLSSLLESGIIPVVAGFQGVDRSGNITTLGRGGSDTTAVALAAAMKADECQIYTDVEGVYTTDPRIVPEARKLDCLTYEEMLEMASLGAKVLQIRAVEFASKYKVNLRVLSSFTDGDGTRIIDEDQKMEHAVISGVALNKNEAQVMVMGVPDRPGIASEILGPVADKNIEVDMIVQNSGADGSTDFTFTVPRSDYEETMKVLAPLVEKMNASRIEGDDKIVKISIVGVGMRSHAGIASKMFASLAKENINIKMISTSEIKISVVVDEKYSELGVRCLHSEFGLGGPVG
ncbi:MAG: aspartate kinase, partial [Pseudomonadota bacterium]|nr:aspartate kinase [Pseudomonadota bacterium]